MSLNTIIKRCISTINKDAKYSLDFKKYLLDPNTNQVQSFFHDLPLNFNKKEGTVDIIVEIPRYEQGKFEISKELPYNPIVQDTKKGKLRFINNIYPFHGYPCNYGAIPQTWEDPTFALEINNNKYFGDNDPLDICEIGSSVKPSSVGSVKKVKILGCLAMIDDGELDWKLLSIDVNDKLVNELNDITDVKEKLPLLLENLTKWFKNYKLPMGKAENEFAYNGEWLNRDRALSVVEECHERWKLLVSQPQKDKFPAVFNSTLPNTPGNNQEIVDLSSQDQYTGPDNEIPLSAEEVFYYSK